jgi:hypothetical protein
MTRPPKSALDERALDTLFDAAPTPEPSAALTARILRDAQAHQPQTAPPALPQRGLFATLATALGGWPTLGGLATATLAGLYIGVAQPDLLSGQIIGVTADAVEEDALTGLLPGDSLFFDTAFVEEG